MKIEYVDETGRKLTPKEVSGAAPWSLGRGTVVSIALGAQRSLPCRPGRRVSLPACPLPSQPPELSQLVATVRLFSFPCSWGLRLPHSSTSFPVFGGSWGVPGLGPPTSPFPAAPPPPQLPCLEGSSGSKCSARVTGFPAAVPPLPREGLWQNEDGAADEEAGRGGGGCPWGVGGGLWGCGVGGWGGH